MRTALLLPALALACQSQWNLVGDARLLGSGVRLTRATNDLGGAMASWKEPLASGFDTRFRFRISDPGGLNKGADGFAFVIQNHGNQALGGFGGAGGFASGDGIHSGADPGIPFTLAVFFDTHKNDEARDPSGNFLTVAMNGHPEAVLWPPKRLALVNELPFKLKDGKEHQARIRFEPPLLTVYLDDRPAPVLPHTVDLRPCSTPRRPPTSASTASTGGGWANHDILEWEWRPPPLPPSPWSPPDHLRLPRLPAGPQPLHAARSARHRARARPLPHRLACSSARRSRAAQSASTARPTPQRHRNRLRRRRPQWLTRLLRSPGSRRHPHRTGPLHLHH
ncbi:MAG: hypothetical protein IPJ98_15460 [Bryobacterales bacterium]|nr:hypothetical protein [Bryobacterales bacterium]